MRIRLTRQLSLVLVALFVTGLCFVNATAQQRRRRSRRITNPVISAPNTQQSAPTTSSTDASVVSTAEDQNAADNAEQQPAPAPTRRTGRTRTTATNDPEAMRRTINRLSTQVTSLSSKLSEMEQQQRTLVDLERLSRAEQRAEGLRAQLRDVEEKQGNLEARAEQIEFEIKPENIERAVATYGSTHPEELRDIRRRQLESEQTRVRSQIATLTTGHARLESAIATADAEAERIRARVDATSNTQQNADANSNGTETPSDNSTTLIAPSTGTTTNIPPPPPKPDSPSSTPR